MVKYIAVLISIIGLMSCHSGDQKKTTTTDIPRIEIPAEVQSALARNTCLSCHKADYKLIGPSYIDIAKNVSDVEQIVELIRHPKPERWEGYPMMIGFPISDKDGELIASWILSLNKKP